MSIATEITRLENAKSSLKSSINSKTDAQHKITNETLEDYSTFVDSISTGLTPTGTINISTNGTHDVTNYASANVNVSGTYDNDFKGYVQRTATSINIPSGTTKIGERAFHWYDTLTSINLPNTITSIDEEAFYYCDSLVLNSLPSSLTTIGDEAFCECESLTISTFPSSLTSIGECAFEECNGLTNITIPCNCSISGSSSYYGSFRRCSGLSTVTLGSPTVPYTQSKAGRYAFYDSSNITKIIMYTSTGTGTANYFYKTSSSNYHTIEFRQANV